MFYNKLLEIIHNRIITKYSKSDPAQDGFGKSAPGTLLRFEPRAPSAQTAIDVFRHQWACTLSDLLPVDGTGTPPLFTQDMRPLELATAFGVNGSLAGKRILELGPLEGAHTYRLEALGAAEIIAVEANVQAWLKCLIVKEQLHLTKSKFLLGDVLQYLDQTDTKFDAIMASGILYHMIDPLALIEKMCRVSDNCFVWTHYYIDPEHHKMRFTKLDVEKNGYKTTFWSYKYTPFNAKFWGGSASNACWMKKSEILRAFTHFGLGQISIIEDNPDHPNGPCFTFTASR